MSHRGEPDFTSLPHFIVHLEERDAGLANLVRGLLVAGWEVLECWGPQQMDVWRLVLGNSTRVLCFGIERGIVDGVLLGSRGGAESDFHPLSHATLAWARACGADVALTDPDRFRPDVATHGLAVLDWLAAGNNEHANRVSAAWQTYWQLRYSPEQRLGPQGLAETKACGIRLIEAAAAGGTTSINDKGPGKLARSSIGLD